MFGRFTRRDRRRATFDLRKVPVLIGIVAVSPLFVFGRPLWPDAPSAAIQTFGIALLLTCIVGRTWCSLFIGGRKTWELVTNGPYALTRNPLYGFSIVGAAGAGAQSGSLALAIVSGAIVAIVFLLRVQQEEQRLLALHGDTYRRYVAHVPRFLPRGRSWRNGHPPAAKPRVVIRTFLDSCLFLLAAPAAELIQHFQHSGVIHVLFVLP
jgi:protein-S-isoprenylcysteine O-methyltransferase Ste14